jgi:TPR repeat protein
VCFTTAAAHYQLAVAHAQYDLAWMYEMGLVFVEQNDAEALRLYKLAAAQGLSIATTNIWRLL